VAHNPARTTKLFRTDSTRTVSQPTLQTTARLLSASATRNVLTSALALTFALATLASGVYAKGKRRPPAVGGAAVVVDERLSALRDAPDVSANLLQRLGRGRYVSVTGERRTRDGLTFLRVAVTSRTSGWVQSDALVRPSRAGEDARLLRLVKGSEEFDRLARARIFLEAFQRSPLRPAVLLLFGDAAEDAAVRLTREASRRLDPREMEAGGAPVSTYFLNYNGLDRYRRHGVVFTFDAHSKQFHYDGAAFREILRRQPNSPEAAEARKRLQSATPALE
jgi:hypothetical protein